MKAGIPSVDEVFEQAIRHAPGSDRSAYLDETCGTNVDLRQRVDRLLKAFADAGSFLDSPAVSVAPTIALPIPERPGTVIGPYKLLQHIGEGGMGVVFMAEQTQPVQRKVALKIIKPGMDSKQVIARFEAERQALAMMDHVNIARVIDGGATESGRPYFVMELINGVPITKYCDDNHLTPRERLELFIPVCQAIQHAHQKGIIHRDIKPSNVLVTLYDGKPVSKVIDFGVAKAIGQKLTDRTLFTNFGTMVGTLEYMSPEQAEMSNLGVDTRSDIYSLGVLLYELLTGSTPLTRKRLKDAANLEILRLIMEEEPQKPSMRLSESGDALASISAMRKTEPAKLSKLMRGELDWIVMKTLEKDRNRRYETANGLAIEVQRYLADEPVQACPPSKWYRMSKFVRRNKVPVIAASLVLLAMVGGIIGTSWGLVRAEQAESAEAERADGEKKAKQEALASAEAEKKAKENAEKREAETKAVLNFVENKIFAAARPKHFPGGLGHDVGLRQAVEAALPFVDKSFKDQPLIEARLRQTLGNSFLYLGDHKIAADQFLAARILYTKHYGPDHVDTLACINGLSNCYFGLGRYTDLLKLCEESLAISKAKLGPNHIDTLGCMVNLALSYKNLGRSQDAIKLYEEALDILKATMPDHPYTFNCMNNLASCYLEGGRNADALKLLEETLALRKAKHGPDHPATLTSISNLASCYETLGRHAEALKLREKTLALLKANFGPDHPDTLACMNNLASSYSDHGQYTDALKLNEETLAREKAKHGPDHPGILRSMHNVAQSYYLLGRHAEALKLNEEALALEKARHGLDHIDTLKSMHDLANCYAALERHTDALRLREETLALRKIKLGLVHPDTLSSMSSLANSYGELGRHTEALKLREETLALSKANLGPNHPDTLGEMSNLVSSYGELGRYADALKLGEETLGLQKAILGPDHPDTLGSMNNLANSYAALGKHAQTIELLAPIEAATRKAFVAGNSWRLAQLLMTLGEARARLGKFDSAEANLVEALPLFVQTRGPTHKDTRECTQAFVDLYAAWHAVLPGKSYDMKAAEWKTRLDALPPQTTNRIPEKAK